MLCLTLATHSHIFFFFFNKPAPPEIYPFPLPAPLPIFNIATEMSTPAVKTRPAPAPGVILSRATVRAARFLAVAQADLAQVDRKSTRLNSSHSQISYAVFCLKKKKQITQLLCETRDDHN